MTTAAKVIAVASSHLGVSESPAGSNRVFYNEWYGVNGISWCATFVSWVLDRSGLPELHGIQNEKGSAFCPYIESYFRKHGRWQGSPQKGAIVFFDWDGDGVSGHIGIVDTIINQNEVITIEGNTSATDNSNGGQVQRRSRFSHQIRGYGIPLYQAQASEPALASLSYQELGEPQLYLASPKKSGEIVRHVQNRLLELGYSVGHAGADGIYGMDTETAVKKFQQDKSLEVDGWIGKETWHALLPDYLIINHFNFSNANTISPFRPKSEYLHRKDTWIVTVHD